MEETIECETIKDFKLSKTNISNTIFVFRLLCKIVFYIHKDILGKILEFIFSKNNYKLKL